MRLFHKNAPFTPVIAEKGNSIILYETKQLVSVPNTTGSRFYEIKVKGKTYLVETKTLPSGVEIAALNTNAGTYEFILREARGNEPVIILNPSMPRAVVDTSDKAAFYLDRPENKVVKESKSEPPSSFWNYETAQLVYNSIAPLSAQITEQIEQAAATMQKVSERLSSSVEGVRAQLEKNLTKNIDLINEKQERVLLQNSAKVQQNSEAIKTASEQLNSSISIAQQQLEHKVCEQLRVLKEQQDAAITQGWKQIEERAHASVTKLVDQAETELHARVSRDLAAQARGIIEEKVLANRTLLQQETQNLFASLSGEARSWLAEQSRVLTESIDSQLHSKETSTEQLLQEKVDTTAIHVSSQLAILEEKIVKQVIRLKEKIDNRIAEGLAELNEATSKSQDLLATIPEDILTEKFEIQKKDLKREFQSSIDKQIASVRKMALHAAESGGGTVAVNYAAGGTINGNLVITGSISAASYLGISLSGGSGTSGAYLPLSGGTTTGGVSVGGTLSAQGIVYALDGSSTNWNNVWTTTNSNSALWNEGTSTVLISNSANWINVTSTVSSNSANWNNVWSAVNTASASWGNAFTVTSTNSAKWNGTTTSLSSNSANWINTTTTVSSNSANWNIWRLNGAVATYTGAISTTNSFGAVSAAVFQATTTINFDGASVVVIPMTGDITFATAGRAAAIGKTVSCILSGDGAAHNLTFEASWNWFVTVPTTIAEGKKGWLTLTSLGAAVEDVYAAYKESV